MSSGAPRDAGDLGSDPAPVGVTVGRVWLPATRCPAGVGGPTPVAIRDGALYDVRARVATMADLLDGPDPIEIATDPRLAQGR